MSRTESIIKSLGMTKWFIVESWKYIATKHLSSRIEYVTGLIPAWSRFIMATYKDYRGV